MASRLLTTTILTGISVVMAACYQPGGSLLPKTGDAETFFSYETQPVTIRLVDLRTQDVLFEMAVPAGKQFTYQFVEGEGDDPVMTPDLMRYNVWDIGTTTGSLTNSLTVPAARSRRIDVYVTQDIKFREAEPGSELRTDQVEDRPDWWTPRGGEMPENTGRTSYDGP